MNTATRELTGELTDDELYRVHGGKITESDTVANQISSAVGWIPFFGTAVSAGVQFGAALGKLI